MRASSSRSKPSSDGCRCVSFAISASAAAAPRHAVARCATTSSRSIDGASSSALLEPFKRILLTAFRRHRIGNASRYQWQVLGRRLLDAPPLAQCLFRLTSLGCDVAGQYQGANRFAVGRQRLIDRLLRFIQRVARQRVARELAVVVRYGNVVRLSGFALQFARTLDRLQPLALRLINAHQRPQSVEAMMPVFQQLHESVFGTVEQTRLQIILPELVERLRSLPCRQIRTIQQVRVNADCTIELAAPTKEIA